MDITKEMTVEDFKKELEIMTDKVVNFQPPKKYQPMSQARVARDLGILDKGIKTKKMLSGQLKYIK